MQCNIGSTIKHSYCKLNALLSSTKQCNPMFNAMFVAILGALECFAMLPRVVVQVLSQLQETSHHDALQNDGGGGDADDVDHVDVGDLDDPDGNINHDDNIAVYRKPVIRMNFKMVMTII